MKSLRYHPHNPLFCSITLGLSPQASRIGTPSQISQTFFIHQSFKKQFPRNFTGLQFLLGYIPAQQFSAGTPLHSDLKPHYLSWYPRSLGSYPRFPIYPQFPLLLFLPTLYSRKLLKEAMGLLQKCNFQNRLNEKLRLIFQVNFL